MSVVLDDVDHDAARLFYRELVRYEMTRGYRVGWSRRTFLARFGYTPPLLWESDPPATVIRPATFQWIRARLAAYARQRETTAARKRRASSKPESYR